MARKTGLFEDVSIAREIAGVIAAENASLVDANYPTSGALGCRGYDTIFVGVEITAGTNPTATIEPLFRDAEAPDGSRWKRKLLGAREGFTLAAALASEDTGALGSNSDLVEIRVDGAPLVFLRVKAVANAASTSNLKILVQPGRKRS
jgi:hypothetical protein